MDPESKKLLENTFKLVEENHTMLKRIRRRQKLSSLFQVLYWVMLVGIAIGAFYFIQPYIENIQKFIKDSGTTINQFKNILPKQTPR